jgi:hypothetical protein
MRRQHERWTKAKTPGSGVGPRVTRAMKILSMYNAIGFRPFFDDNIVGLSSFRYLRIHDIMPYLSLGAMSPVNLPKTYTVCLAFEASFLFVIDGQLAMNGLGMLLILGK